MEAFGRFMNFLYVYLLSVSACVFLVVVVPMTLIVRERIKQAKKEQRNWFQLSLLSILLVTLVLGTLITANTVSYDYRYGAEMTAQVRGVPFPFTDISGSVIGLFLIWDILIGIGSALLVLFISEAYVRNRELKRRDPKPKPPPAWR